MQTSGIQALTTAQAAIFKQAMGILQAGLPLKALEIARDLVGETPRAADAWQLLGMCQAGAGDGGAAEISFERALALAPKSNVISRNYGFFLVGRGKSLREQQQLVLAESVLRKAVGLAPDLASAWVELGSVLRQLGRTDEGIDALERGQNLIVQQRGSPSIEVANAINGALAEVGRPFEAITAARKQVAENPGHPAAHEVLSSLLWEYGSGTSPDENPLHEFVISASRQPKNIPLQLSLVRMMLSMDKAASALEILRPLRQMDPFDPMLMWFHADALDAMGENHHAAGLYARVARSALGDESEFLNAWARHAFRSGRVELAARCANQVVSANPENQEGWSHLGTVWRLQKDEREHWLCGYESLVGFVEVEPPLGFADMSTFVDALNATLGTRHNAIRPPVNQSVRGGTQTGGNLFGANDPMIRLAESSLRKAAENWFSGLPEDLSHPFLSKRKKDIHFAASWSVRLASGRHSNHIHPKGWASSAFYVSLPESVVKASEISKAGWLQFGQPLESLGLDLQPRRFIRPKAGFLALFPSYLWHGTVPFDDVEPRVTIAFDMQPNA